MVLNDEYEQVYLHGGDDLLRVCFNMGIVYVSMTNETLFSKANTINAAFILDCNHCIRYRLFVDDEVFLAA